MSEGSGPVGRSLAGKPFVVMGMGLVVLVVVGLFTVFLWSNGTNGAEMIDGSDPGLVAMGKEIYSEHCASCHGDNLEGEPDWRRRDAEGYLPAPPHDETGHTWHHPDDHLFTVTKHGTVSIAPEGYKTRMSGYGDVLTDRQIRAALAYIKSTWPPREREVQNRINGRKP